MQVQNHQTENDVAPGIDTSLGNAWLDNPNGGPGAPEQADDTCKYAAQKKELNLSPYGQNNLENSTR